MAKAFGKLLFWQRRCPHCGMNLRDHVAGPFHGGLSNVATAYCEKCGRSLHFSSYSERFRRLTPHEPWNLSDGQKRLIEGALAHRDCGGSFRFDASPRCPGCAQPLTLIGPGSTMYVRIEPSLDEQRGAQIWSAQAERLEETR
jgi:hypothetical protein